MQWLLTRVLVLCVAMTALIGSVVAYRRAQAAPNPLLAYGLDVCDGKPCFMGITPDVTSWDEAQSLMAKRGAVDGLCLDAKCVTITVHGVDFTVMTKDNLHVTSISAATYVKMDHMPNLGSMVAQYGTPCAVDAFNPHSYHVVYPTLVFGVYGDVGTRFTGNSLIDMLQVGERGPEDLHGLCQTIGTERPWLGFASYVKYQARLPQFDTSR